MLQAVDKHLPERQHLIDRMILGRGKSYCHDVAFLGEVNSVLRNLRFNQ